MDSTEDNNYPFVGGSKRLGTARQIWEERMWLRGTARKQIVFAVRPLRCHAEGLKHGRFESTDLRYLKGIWYANIRKGEHLDDTI